MFSKVVFLSFTVFLVAQFYQSHGFDTRLLDCSNKILEEYNNMREGKIPSCVDEEAYYRIPEHVEGFKKYFKELSPSCEENYSECFKEIGTSLLKNSIDMQFDIMDSMRLFHDAFGKCWQNARDTFQSLDHYILNGCEDLVF